MNRKARAASASQSGSPNATPALARPAIIRPFQSASTLSSRPGRIRRARAASSFSRIGASSCSSSMLRGKCLSRLRIVCPSKLPSSGHVIVRSKFRSIVRAQHLVDLGQRPDVELALLAFRVGIERGAERAVRRGHLAREPADRLARAGARVGHWPSAAMRARAAPAAARCRTASSRSAAPASARPPSSARTRRRGGRRCRPRTSARATARPPRNSAGRRCAARRARETPASSAAEISARRACRRAPDRSCRRSAPPRG